MKRTLTIDYGDEVLQALGYTPKQFREEAKILIAVKLYELGRLSSGGAAKLAGIPKPLFLTKLAEYGIDTFQLTEDDLQQDIDSARRLAGKRARHSRRGSARFESSSIIAVPAE